MTKHCKVVGTGRDPSAIAWPRPSEVLDLKGLNIEPSFPALSPNGHFRNLWDFLGVIFLVPWTVQNDEGVGC